MKMRVLHFGEDLLRKPSEPVPEITPELKRLVDDMFETMYEERGVGLAAPQVGRNVRLFIIDLDKEKMIFINPEILSSSGKDVCEEGCLSFPGLRENVQRALKVKAQATDLDGTRFEIEAEGLFARAIQHELDHLDGVLFVDRISKARRFQIKHDLEVIAAGGSLEEEEEEEEETPEEETAQG
jgi:peptide deformylase